MNRLRGVVKFKNQIKCTSKNGGINYRLYFFRKYDGCFVECTCLLSE